LRLGERTLGFGAAFIGWPWSAWACGLEAETAEEAEITRGRAGLEPDSSAARGREVRPAGPMRQRERERGKSGVSGLVRGEGGWWAAHAGGERKERERVVAGLPGGGEERGRRKKASWAGPKGEKREGKERRTKQIQKAFEFELKFEFKRETTKISMQELEMHKHMTFPIFIFIL
jgi:hypothetical protein